MDKAANYSNYYKLNWLRGSIALLAGDMEKAKKIAESLTSADDVGIWMQTDPIPVF